MKVGDYYIRNDYNWDGYMSSYEKYQTFELLCEITKIIDGLISYKFLSYKFLSGENRISIESFLGHFIPITIAEKEKFEEQYKNEIMIKDIIE